MWHASVYAPADDVVHIQLIGPDRVHVPYAGSAVLEEAAGAAGSGEFCLRYHDRTQVAPLAVEHVPLRSARRDLQAEAYLLLLLRIQVAHRPHPLHQEGACRAVVEIGEGRIVIPKTDAGYDLRRPLGRNTVFL